MLPDRAPEVLSLGAMPTYSAVQTTRRATALAIGFDTVDCRALAAAHYLEPFAMTWIQMAIKLGHGRRFAFARMHR